MFDKGDSYAKLKISHLPRQFNCEDKLMAAIEEYNKSVPSRLKSYVNVNDCSY